MVLPEIEARVKDIASYAHDPERAHSLEDDLHKDVLRYHANRGCELANAALQTGRIDFPRWTA